MGYSSVRTGTAALTPSELRAIDGLKSGGSIKEVALRLGISPNTLKERLKTIYAKLEVHSARELLVKLYLGSPEPAPQRTDVLRRLEAVLDAPSISAALRALANAIATQLDLRAEVIWPMDKARYAANGFFHAALTRGEARSDFGVADLPGWAPPLAALRLSWDSEHALLVMSDPRQGMPDVSWRSAALLARFAEASLAQSRATRAAR
ncbi:MAG: LuxR C-terminal-related transcriptional regulator [Terriglobales bacterium]